MKLSRATKKRIFLISDMKLWTSVPSEEDQWNHLVRPEKIVNEGSEVLIDEVFVFWLSEKAFLVYQKSNCRM